MSNGTYVGTVITAKGDTLLWLLMCADTFMQCSNPLAEAPALGDPHAVRAWP